MWLASMGCAKGCSTWMPGVRRRSGVRASGVVCKLSLLLPLCLAATGQSAPEATLKPQPAATAPAPPACPDRQSVYRTIKSQLQAALPKPWRVKLRSEEGGREHLELTGPARRGSICGHGDDASQFSCRPIRSPVRYLIRLEARSDFHCPDQPQHSIYQAGRLPSLESRCHYLFFYQPVGVRQPELMRQEITAVLVKVLEARAAEVKCAGWPAPCVPTPCPAPMVRVENAA